MLKNTSPESSNALQWPSFDSMPSLSTHFAVVGKRSICAVLIIAFVHCPERIARAARSRPSKLVPQAMSTAKLGPERKKIVLPNYYSVLGQ